MAFPVTEATATSVEASATTSHTVSLPASIVSGDLLIVWFGVEHTSDSTVAWPGGWTEIDETFSTDMEGAVAYRIADATEGASITVTSGQSAESGHIAYRISGGKGDAPAIASFAHSNAANACNLPELTPGWGSAPDTLWLAARASATGNSLGDPPNTPTFTDIIESADWGTGGNNAVSEYEANVASIDPDHYSTSPSGYGVAWTLAVEPATPPPLNLNRVSAMHFQRHYEPTAMGA